MNKSTASMCYMRYLLTNLCHFLLLLFTLVFSHLSFAQSSFIPQKLDNNVNTEYSDLNPVLSPDQKYLYFSRKNHPDNEFGKKNSQDIWVSEINSDQTYSLAKKMPYPFNTARSNALLSISQDGSIYLISGVFTKSKVNWKKRGLSVITKTGDGWSKPVRLKVPGYSRKNKGEYSNSYLSEDGNILLLAFTKRWMKKDLDLYVSKKNKRGNWSSPKRVKNLKDYNSVEAPFLSKDNFTLYFSGYDSKKEQFDIFTAKKLDDSYVLWSSPVRLSDTINSKTSWDSYFKTNQKGSWAYFCSDKDQGTESDIYKVKVFEENPFVVVSGIVIDSISNAPLDKKYSFKIIANGIVADSVVINPDSSSFILKLPLGKKYILGADADHFIGIPDTIDVSNVREYTEQKKNLYVKPVPYVLVTGRFLNKSNNTILPASSRPKLAVDGNIIDSAIIDSEKGTYTVKIARGKSHSLQVLADKFNPIVVYLDLNNEKYYKEYSKDLYAEQIRLLALVTGKVYNKKTNKPMSPKVDYEVRVNDLEKTNTQINKATAEYSLEIPVGQQYTINARANKYFPLYETIDLRNETTSVKIYKDLYLAPLEIGSSIKLNNVFFESGSALLKKESNIELDKVVSFLNEYPEVKIEIGGHTDNVGNAAKNLTLSDKRAAAVVKYIEGKGIADERISYKGYGSNKPVVPNTTPANKAKNRRVEFTILDI